MDPNLKFVDLRKNQLTHNPKSKKPKPDHPYLYEIIVYDIAYKTIIVICYDVKKEQAII